jgi:hypothetical protein
MRSIVRSFATLGPFILAACAAGSSGEDIASRSSAITHCPPGTKADCSGDGPNGQLICTCDPIVTEYSVGGQVTGLSTQGLAIALYQSQSVQYQVTIARNGPFSFGVPDGPYDVYIASQPSGQACSIANSSGTVSGAAINNIVVTCGTAYTVGGTATGLKQQLYLDFNGGNEGDDHFAVNQSGAFTSPRTLANGGTYDITVWSQPQGQQCAVTNGSGTIAGANVTNVEVLCIDLPCGGSGQHACIVGAPCTANATANASDTCECNPGNVAQSDGSCVACGASGEPVCAGGTCNSASLVDVGGKCKPCGASGDPTCAGDKCNAGLVGKSGSCTPCGNYLEPVCSGGVCGPYLVNQNGTCIGCGGGGDPVCPPNNWCESGLVDSGGTCVKPSGGSSSGGGSGSSGGGSCGDFTCWANCGSGCFEMGGTYCSYQDANQSAQGCQVCCGTSSECASSATCLEGIKRVGAQL